MAKTLSIAKEGVEKFTWPVSADKIGNAKISLYAIGQNDSDALERQLNINPLGIKVTNVMQGVLNETNPSVNLKRDFDKNATDLKSSLNLAGSTFAQLNGSYSSLIDYPYGCTEQTMSRLVPSIVAFDMHKNFGIDLDQTQIQRFQKVKSKSLSRLKDLQHYDGGWGWWSNDSSDPYLTAYVLEGLKLLQDANLAETKYLVKSGINWLNKAADKLTKQLQDPKLVEDYLAKERRTDLARIVYVQSIYGITPSKGTMTWLNSKVSILPQNHSLI